MTPLADGAVPCVLGDPEPLRLALLSIMDNSGDQVARLQPQEPYLVQRKGLLGRVKTDEVLVGSEAVWYADETGSGQFCVNLFHPEGWPGAAGRPIPAGSRPTVADATYFSFDLDLAASPARAANDIVGLCVAVFGTAMGSAWKVTVVDLTLGLGD